MKTLYCSVCFALLFSNAFSQILEPKELAIGGHYAFANHEDKDRTNYHGLGFFFDLKGHERVANMISADVFIPRTEQFTMMLGTSNQSPDLRDVKLTTTLANFSFGYRVYAFLHNKAFNGLLKGLSLEVNFGLGLKYNHLRFDDEEAIEFGNYSHLDYYDTKMKASFIYALGIGYQYPLEYLIPYIQIYRRSSFAKFGTVEEPIQDEIFYNNAIAVNLGVKIPWN